MTFLSSCAWLVLFGWACVTYTRAEVWQSNTTLWTDATAKAPLRPRGFINLGIEKELAGDLNGASQAYLTALALSQQPRLSTYSRTFHRAAAEVNNARVMARAGHPGIALSLLEDVLTRHPHFTHAHFQKGVLLVALGQCQLGLDSIRDAGPGFPDVTCTN